MPAPALRFEEPTFDPTFLESITSFIVATCPQFHVRRADVFDVVQEALTKIVASVGSFRPEEGDFNTWARGVAFNVIRRHARNTKRYGGLFSEYHPNVYDYATHEPSPERCAQRKQARCSISNAMGKLTTQQASVVLSFGVDEMSHSEVGNELSISEDASHKCYERARNKLAQCIQNDLLSTMPLFVSRCDKPATFNETSSRWAERSHYVVQLGTAIMAVFLVFSLKSSTITHESTTGDARVLAPVQNVSMYRSDERVEVQDEPAVLHDAPSVKPEPASLPGVRVVSTPTRGGDKPTYVQDLAPLPPYKYDPASADHHLFGNDRP